MTQSNKKYSIILPVKNGGEYVKECVNNILAQTLNNFNLIILDNCSTDATVNWINEINDSRIELYKSDTPLSMADNWGRIVSIKKNEFMTIIGHDDIFHTNYLATIDRLITEKPDASLFQTHFKIIDGKGNDIRDCKPMKEKLYAYEFLECEMKQTLDSMGTGYMMRSSDYDAAGGISTKYPNLIFADYELWMKLILKSYLAISPEKSFSYRIHNNISLLTNGEDYQQAFCMYMQFLVDLKSKNQEIAATIEESAYEMLLYFCESLSHRLLKTPRTMRKTTVREFINKCKEYALLLIPKQSFRPLLKPRIFAAKMLDNAVGIFLFKSVKKLISR